MVISLPEAMGCMVAIKVAVSFIERINCEDEILTLETFVGLLQIRRASFGDT